MYKFHTLMADVRGLNPNDPSLWPKAYQYVLLLLISLIIIVIAWFYCIAAVRDDIDSLQHQEISLKAAYRVKFEVAQKIDFYRQQKQQLSTSLAKYKAELPAATEMAGLLHSVTVIAAENDLTMGDFIPQAASRQKNFVSQKIDFKITGSFSNLMQFFTQLGQLDLLIKIDAFTITSNNNFSLTMTATASTFSYLEP